MDIILHKSLIEEQSSITVTGSKSESNRLLLLQALYPAIKIKNLSNSDDSRVMKLALSTSDPIIDIHHAGTAMRFLTAYFAMQEGREVILTGSLRMKQRPIQILVEALNQLGADIQYLETEGCPPLKIKGKKLTKDKVTLRANVSSQYISALLLIAPKLENGQELTLEGTITSIPYINMTLDLLHQIGVETRFEGQTIKVKPLLLTQNPKPKTFTVESDWSSASYFYSIVALSELGTEITLSSYKKNSLQGDSVLAEIYKSFGVETTFHKTKISIKKALVADRQLSFDWDLSNAPDIAQTIAVTCLGLGLECHLTGLHTLKIKETDRLVALKTEMEKFGINVEITDRSLHLLPLHKLRGNPSIATYNDHRMAMAFAPMALKTNLQIEEANVVSKSYPTFWEDLKSIGFQIK
ncbi:MAG TPA: 3-phosphoshikimate 1-carboxyvinyltransferase [Flavobacteriaceae bacterium]|nr:3-phosphoshikimate 1-carboxyvinyltransferase [Flavobacteriaceae bacterium]